MQTLDELNAQIAATLAPIARTETVALDDEVDVAAARRAHEGDMRVAAEQDVFACDRAYLVANL